MNGFSWVIPGRLAGMARPRETGVWQWVTRQGVELVVCLTRRPDGIHTLTKHGLMLLHLPVGDFTAPSQRQIAEFVTHEAAVHERGRATVVHCAGGHGRTGTMLASALVADGLGADEAIARVREARPGSIETRGQERAVREFAANRRSA